MKTLSIFVDESGDFGKYEHPSPYYLLTLVLHDQSIPISNKLYSLDTKLNNYYPNTSKTVVHAGPIIRNEEIFRQIDLSGRKHIFNAMFAFAMSIELKYTTIAVNKKEDDSNPFWLETKLVKGLITFINNHLDYFLSYDKIIIYYDDGQKEINRILNSVFLSHFNSVEFRKVKPYNYRLFQVADLCCTLELLNLKKEAHSFSKSEEIFFENYRRFNKNYYKSIKRKKLE